MYQLRLFLMGIVSGMDNMWNKLSLGTGVIGGFLISFWGGWDSLIAALITLIAIDYVTGVMKAVYSKKLSSEIGYRGLMKKVLILIVVGAAVVLQAVLPENVPLREITIVFFLCNEGISILENAATMIPIPKKLKDILLQLRGTDDDEKADKKKK